jgi:flagellar M-ring protein FliF
MSELVPMAGHAPAPSLLAPLTDPGGGNALSRLRSFAGQGPVRRMLPVFLGLSALGGVALTWGMLSPAPQRVLYSQLSDGERAGVVDALDKASIAYRIDNGSGTLTVNEDDLYRARMVVASDGALATPQTGSEMLDSLPMGASKAMEGERLRAARERDLQFTIKEIDGVESVRVHLAEGEKSVFVRENMPPTASVMVRLARGRQLSQSQVGAIVNLVAGSVPGLSSDAVRVVDQHGRLLSERTSVDGDRLELQSRMEDKLREQVSTLLTPMLGSGNFSSEIQIELDMDQVTSARESYEKEGAVRSEALEQSQQTVPGPAIGVPGVTSNTPPPQPTAVNAPPEGTPAAAASPQTSGESSSRRTFELGREVAVANSTPGKLKRVSVAVAISQAAMQNAKPGEIDQIKQLVSAAVGADPQRGDQVAVVLRKFEPVESEAAPFYEQPWFALVLRNAVALIAVLLVLLLGVRPLIKALRGDPRPEPAPIPIANDAAAAAEGDAEAETIEPAEPEKPELAAAVAATIQANSGIDPEELTQQVGIAQRLVEERPDSALAALRQMLNPREPGVAQ